jgi:hypothetical protein
MPKVTIQPPKDAGAARISVFAPDGRMLAAPRLVLPPNGTFEFDAPKPGTYTASLESLGAGHALWSFPVEGSEVLTVQAPPLGLARAGRPGAADASIGLGESDPVGPGEIATVDIGADYEREASPDGFRTHTFGLGIQRDVLSAMVTASPTSLSLSPAPGPAYSLGLSYDSRPLSHGGWRPFMADKMVRMRHTDLGDVEVNFDRGDELLPPNSGARLRLSFAIEATRVQRILVPLFAGGVTARLRTATTPYLSNDKLSIVPSRPETHALLQALTSNSTEVATGIWKEIGLGPAHLARYASADVNDDPWVSVAVGLLMLRLGRLRDNDYWIDGLAQRHPWVADASILAAHQRLAQTPPDVDGALKYLQQARRVGAVYFFEANRQQGDLLVALAADAPQNAHRQLAAAELRRWRTNLANQVQVGAFFSWLMTHGARTRGGLDQRYSAIVDSGRLMAQGGERPSPLQARAGVAGAS